MPIQALISSWALRVLPARADSLKRQAPAITSAVHWRPGVIGALP